MNSQPLIDAHHHFWALDGIVHYPWLEDEIDQHFFLGDYSSIRRPFLAPDLQALIPEGYHLAGSVHCEAEADRRHPEIETNWLTSHGKRFGLPVALVGWAAFGHQDCEAQLEAQMHSPLFRGVRAKPLTASRPVGYDDVKGAPGSLQDTNWTRGLELLEERGLSWDLRVPAWHLLDAAEVLERRPRLKVILNHTGLPWDRTRSGLDGWRLGMRRLAENPSIAVKLSELGSPMADWDRKQNIELLAEAISIFGPDRCIFASNFPVTGLNASYATWLEMVEQAISLTAPYARHAILHNNAVHWYQLNVPVSS
ncbi:amidohydrolase family protein [Aidingimonas lacisalsi]|uniref:amidohydrolase family protein n=1 Tax=Aidingimonas lacisalsi TaxID=2604086 RepID=UPI0011D222CF|nr:amidohydrolase family protein [Aidingimonas lacisalsi]